MMDSFINAQYQNCTNMNKDSTGKTRQTNQTDWARVATLRDEDIAYDADNPMTTEADWEGAVMKTGDKVIGGGARAREAKEAHQNPDDFAPFS